MSNSETNKFQKKQIEKPVKFSFSPEAKDIFYKFCVFFNFTEENEFNEKSFRKAINVFLASERFNLEENGSIVGYILKKEDYKKRDFKKGIEAFKIVDLMYDLTQEVLLGNIRILNTEHGEKLKKLIEINKVSFKPFIIGKRENDKIEVKKLITFNAIYED